MAAFALTHSPHAQKMAAIKDEYAAEQKWQRDEEVNSRFRAWTRREQQDRERDVEAAVPDDQDRKLDWGEWFVRRPRYYTRVRPRSLVERRSNYVKFGDPLGPYTTRTETPACALILLVAGFMVCCVVALCVTFGGKTTTQNPGHEFASNLVLFYFLWVGVGVPIMYFRVEF